MNNWFNRIANEPRIRAVRQAAENLPPGVRRAAQAGATGAAVGVAVFAIPPILGFTTAGVAAGSAAAFIQSAVYGAAVPAGSIFAAMQSIGATATIVPAVVAAAGAAGGAAAVMGDGEDGGEHPAERQEEGEENIEEADNVQHPNGQEKNLHDFEDRVLENPEKLLVFEAETSQSETNNTADVGLGGQELVRPRNNVS